MPQWYLQQPESARGDEFYLRAFWDLSTTRRAWGAQLGPIPWDRIVHYGMHYGLDAVMMEVFVRVIRALDEEWLSGRVSH